MQSPQFPRQPEVLANRGRLSRNPAFIAMIALPALAIAASLAAAAVAFLDGDPTLPDEYHWEGAQLDQDFATARRAFDLDVRAALRVVPAAGLCRVTLQLNSPPPPAITLALIHGSRPDLDRRLRLTPGNGSYEAPCGSLPAAHWRVELADEAHSWTVRQEFSGSLDAVTIAARPNGG